VEELTRVPRLTVVLFVVIAALACLPAAAQVTTATVAVANNPGSAAVNSVVNTIYVANTCGNDPTCQSGNGSVTIINGNTLATQTISVAAYPDPIVVNSVTNMAYAATCDSATTCATGTVTVINGNTLATQTVNTGVYPDWVAVNPVSNKIYVTNECNDANCTTFGTLTVMDGVTLNTQNVTVGAYAVSVAVNTTTNKIYVVNQCGNDLTCDRAGTVSVIDGNNLNNIQTVTVGFDPSFAAVDETHDLIYVSNYGGADGSGNPGTVTVINGSTLSTQTVNVGVDPVPVVVNPGTNLIYVGNQCGSDPTCASAPSATIINGNTLATSTVSICNVRSYPATQSSINLVTNKIYFPCRGSTNSSYGLSVTELDGATNATTPIAVGDYPNAAAINPVANQIYVPNGGDGTVSVIGGNTKLQLVNVSPCRVVDTRQANGEFGGPPITGGTSRSFPIPQNQNCNIPSSAAGYSLNVTVVPPSGGTLGYLTIWPTPEIQPVVSTLNSPDGRTKANAAIVPAGVSGAVSVYVSDTANVILDIDGYYAPASSSTYQFYPLRPCRVVDTRGADGELGGPRLAAQTPRSFPLLMSSCIPAGLNPNAYSLNFTVVPNPSGQPLGYLSVWPTGAPQPVVSTLNNPTATVVANAAIVPAGTGGAIDVYANNTTDLLIDIDGYFAPAGTGGLSMYPAAPCRVLDTRQVGNGRNGQPFAGTLSPPVNVVGSVCAPPSSALAYIFNATVVPSGSLGYLTLWPDGSGQPVVSTLNAYDGFITSNMAIVPSTNGSIDAYAQGLTQLILDISGYFAP